MTDDRPLVSIVLPTYNRERYLREAIGSVFAQTYANWELIIVDDGSTDGTSTYLARISDARVRVVTGPHCGNRAQLRNRAGAGARGEYVAFLDSDDYWVPAKLERQVADLRSRARRWGYARHRWVDDEGQPLPLPAGRQWKACDGWILQDVIAADAWIAMPTVIMERSLLAEIGGFDETFLSLSDYEAWVRLAARAEAAFVSEPLAVVRLHAGNVPRHTTMEVHEQLTQLYLRLSRDPGTALHRGLCLARFAEASLGLADRCRVAGNAWRALSASMAALRVRPFSLRAWTTLAKCAAYPFVPAAALAAYHRIHAASPERNPSRA